MIDAHAHAVVEAIDEKADRLATEDLEGSAPDEITIDLLRGRHSSGHPVSAYALTASFFG